jgi:hypothetical protein
LHSGERGGDGIAWIGGERGIVLLPVLLADKKKNDENGLLLIRRKSIIRLVDENTRRYFCGDLWMTVILCGGLSMRLRYEIFLIDPLSSKFFAHALTSDLRTSDIYIYRSS